MMRGRMRGTRLWGSPPIRVYPWRPKKTRTAEVMDTIVEDDADGDFWRFAGKRWRRALIRAWQRRVSQTGQEYVSKIVPPVIRDGIARPHGVPPGRGRLDRRSARKWRRL